MSMKNWMMVLGLWAFGLQAAPDHVRVLREAAKQLRKTAPADGDGATMDFVLAQKQATQAFEDAAYDARKAGKQEWFNAAFQFAAETLDLTPDVAFLAKKLYAKDQARGKFALTSIRDPRKADLLRGTMFASDEAFNQEK